MADTSNPKTPSAQIASCAEPVERIRILNERLIQRAMAVGSRTLDAYERAPTTLVELTEKAGATQLEWLAAIAQAHADFVRDVSRA